MLNTISPSGGQSFAGIHHIRALAGRKIPIRGRTYELSLVLYVVSEMYVSRTRQERFGAKACDIENQLIRVDLCRKGEGL